MQWSLPGQATSHRVKATREYTNQCGFITLNPGFLACSMSGRKMTDIPLAQVLSHTDTHTPYIFIIFHPISSSLIISSNNHHSNSTIIPPHTEALRITFPSTIDIIIYFIFKCYMHYNAISMMLRVLSPGQPEAQQVRSLLSACLLPSWVDYTLCLCFCPCMWSLGHRHSTASSSLTCLSLYSLLAKTCSSESANLLPFISANRTHNISKHI